jgi:serine/threonine-protein kinase ULK/ATG1
VHRDIKPENIFVKNGVIKLGDFGMCMIGTPALADKTKIGSVLFMAPESIARFEYS